MSTSQNGQLRLLKENHKTSTAVYQQIPEKIDKAEVGVYLLDSVLRLSEHFYGGISVTGRIIAKKGSRRIVPRTDVVRLSTVSQAIVLIFCLFSTQKSLSLRFLPSVLLQIFPYINSNASVNPMSSIDVKSLWN